MFQDVSAFVLMPYEKIAGQDEGPALLHAKCPGNVPGLILETTYSLTVTLLVRT